MKGAAVILILLGFFLSVSGQTAVEEQFPPGLKWKAIHFRGQRVVFPEEILEDARRVAGMLASLQEPLRKTLTAPSETFPLILNNQSVVANGFVAVAPKRSEWYTCPARSGRDADFDWFQTLAVHEGRHMVQFTKSNQGWVKTFGAILGEAGRGGAMAVLIPFWLLEGDAVVTETAMTAGGRGRQPSFTLAPRSHILAGRRFSYARAALGSYKFVYMNDYSLGYLLVAHLRRKYGGSFWDSVFDETCHDSRVAHDGLSRVLVEKTGKKLSEIYLEMVQEREKEWRAQLEETSLTGLEMIPLPDKKVWTQYISPQSMADGSLLACRYGLGDTASLVRIDESGREQKITAMAPAETESTRISLGGGKVVWEELHSHPRWGRRVDARLAIYDLVRHKILRLSGPTRALNPALSPDGKQIAAVEFSGSGVSRVVLYNSESGRLLERLPGIDGDEILAPAWSPCGRKIVWVSQNRNGRLLVIWDEETGKIRPLGTYSPEAIDQPLFWNNFILFISPLSGIDNVHALHIDTGEQFQVTSVPLGAAFPAVGVDGRRLYFSTYSSLGYDLARIDLDPGDWRLLPEEARRGDADAVMLTEQEQHRIDPDTVPLPDSEAITDYRPGWRDFRFHSRYFYFDDQKIEFLFQGDDLLGRAGGYASAEYRTRERSLGLRFGAEYRAWFPLLAMEWHGGGRRFVYEKEDGASEIDRWGETGITLAMRIPLKFDGGVWTTRLEPGVAVDYLYYSGRDLPAGQIQRSGGSGSLTLSLRFSQVRSYSLRDLQPRWGDSLRFFFRKTIFSGNVSGYQAALRAAVYFPGLFRHHGLKIMATAETFSSRELPFAPASPAIRGYGMLFLKKQLQLSLDYVFPLAYPDAALGNWFYLKRIKAGLFWEAAWGGEDWFSQHFDSAGIEWLNDVHLISLPVPVELGMRVCYRFRERSFRFEPLVLLYSW